MLCVRAHVAVRWRARVYPLPVLRRRTEPPAGWPLLQGDPLRIIGGARQALGLGNFDGAQLLCNRRRRNRVGDQVQLVRGRACPEPETVPSVEE
jgi:hypothetical protein